MNKFYIPIILGILFCFIFCIFNISRYYSEPIDITALNQIQKAVERLKGQEQLLEDEQFSYDFSIVHEDGAIPYSTIEVQPENYQVHINEAIRNHETVLFYDSGAIIIYTNAFMETQRERLIGTLIATAAALILLIGLQIFYIHIRLIRPFQRLKGFAAAIARGQLDIPLPMDRTNLFGAFTEGFDLMREELNAAREKAILLEKQKNEMVASLSHDIKTPLASIIAVSEMMLLTETQEPRIQKLQGIGRKAEEIDHLVTDLFQTTLEDLSELKVETDSYSSDALVTMIQHADLLHCISNIPTVPPCLVRMDPLRMGQVFSNVISNAYKYAGTHMEIDFALVDKEKRMLKILVKDHGNSFREDELPKLGSKFYRGSNAKGMQGAGLGLYNCRRLLDRMEGFMEFSQEPSGFCVWIYLNLA